MNLKLLLFLLWSSLAGPLVGTYSEDLTSLAPILDDLTSLEKSLLTLEDQLTTSKTKIQNLQDLIGLIETQSQVQGDLLLKQQKNLALELLQFTNLSNLCDQLKSDYQRLKASSTVKTWSIVILIVAVVGSFFVGRATK